MGSLFGCLEHSESLRRRDQLKICDSEVLVCISHLIPESQEKEENINNRTFEIFTTRISEIDFFNEVIIFMNIFSRFSSHFY